MRTLIDMERKHFHWFVVVGLLFGLGLECLKHSASKPLQASHAVGEADASPETPVLSRLFSAVVRPRLRRALDPNTVAALEPSLLPSLPTLISEATATDAAKPAAKRTRAAAKDDKKKKKKEDDKKAQAFSPPADGPDALEQKKPSSKLPDSTIAGGGQVIDGGSDGAAASGSPRTQAEWEAFLLGTLDSTRVQGFVRAYRSGTVSATVFYAVVHEMLADGRSDMRHQGLLALAATPSEASFAALVNFHATGSSGGDREKAETYLRVYGNSQYFSVLASAIQAPGDAPASLYAIQILTASAALNLKHVASRVPDMVPGGVTEAGTAETASAADVARRDAVAKRYVAFLTVLSQVSKTNPSAPLRHAALEAMAAIRTDITNSGYTG